MRDEEHFVQDALEVYAVAYLQKLAEERCLAITHDSSIKYAEFEAYARARGLGITYFETGRWRDYKATYDRHLPAFFDRLTTKFPGASFDFTNVEAANRNAQLKGDFVIDTSRKDRFSVSMKNYRGDARRPQVNSGTYNSFILNFLFNSPAVGTFTDPVTGMRFRSTPISIRDTALRSNGYDDIIPLMHDMDKLNEDIRRRFIETSEFEFLDERVFNIARKECGDAGAAIALEVLRLIGVPRVHTRLLKMIGMDGSEELLLMDPQRFADSITNAPFRALRESLHGPTTTLTFRRRGQGIGFDFMSGDSVLLQVDVPFTINKNGAWISGDNYPGTRLHSKEGLALAYGQRRPKKSKELATSINTYVNFGAAGIFGTP